MMNKTVFKSLFFTALITAAPVCAYAQETGSKTPVNISADAALEWNRDKGEYIARGNAAATQGDTTLFADQLSAEYDLKGGSPSDIHTITADSNVRIENGEMTVFADKGVYTVSSERAVLTGDDLRLVANDAEVTAEDSLVYDVSASELRAVGEATLIRGEDRLITQELIAELSQNAEGATEVRLIRAPYPVMIKTKAEVITGNTGRFDVGKNQAVLEGDIKITQGQNILTGDRVSVDMNTGISRLFAAQESGGIPGRVSGTFFPADAPDNGGGE